MNVKGQSIIMKREYEKEYKQCQLYEFLVRILCFVVVVVVVLFCFRFYL